ncbi:BlaI/MecI/CopY family transcriptional regulator [Paenibacillus chartarius]|uniref:BlaI/MecI/CopY family transcriptional regulator n=1 Tax=Paenibacillus chartarius TaxID=747481 RepID=A0ABV6DFV0_9BACL
MKITNFKFHERGLNRFFGPLEARILDILWEKPEQSIKAVQEKLDQEKPINFNTVMTVMNRLVDKGILSRRSAGRSSVYSPTESKEHFLEKQSKEITHELIEDFGPLVVNHMIDAIEDVNPELLEQLEQKIKAMKKER